MRKKVRLFIGGAIALVVAVCTLPLKTSIDKTINTVQWKLNDTDNTKNVAVKVKGTYRNYLFRSDTFEGDIVIDEYEEFNNSSLCLVRFHDGMGDVVYEDKDDWMKLRGFGFLLCSPDFSEVLIGTHFEDGGWNGDDGNVLCGSASTYTEALEVARKLSKKSDWLSKGNTFG